MTEAGKACASFTEEIARRHGHTESVACQECGTTESVHFGGWFDPKEKTSGPFLECCPCGIKRGDSLSDHSDCGSIATQLVPHAGEDAALTRAYEVIKARASDAYRRGQGEAQRLNLEGEEAHQYALAAVLSGIGIAYAAAALQLAVITFPDGLDETAATTLETAAGALYPEVTDDLAEAAYADCADIPQTRVLYQAEGWVMGDEPYPQKCTSNHFRRQDGRPPCTHTASWKTVEAHDLTLSIGFYCDEDLPEEYRELAAAHQGEAKGKASERGK